MAGSITHIVLAEQMLQRYEKNAQKKAFILGNLFPDIRYLGDIERTKTHQEGVSFADVLSESNAFTSGMLFHSFVDEKRERIVQETGIYDVLPEKYLVSVALKISEDVAFYAMSEQWPLFMSYLKGVIQDEKQFDIPDIKIKQWHDINRDYFSNPTIAGANIFLKSLGFDEEKLSTVFEYVDALSGDGSITHYTQNIAQKLAAEMR
jgi:hypothetical protein